MVPRGNRGRYMESLNVFTIQPKTFLWCVSCSISLLDIIQKYLSPRRQFLPYYLAEKHGQYNERGGGEPLCGWWVYPEKFRRICPYTCQCTTLNFWYLLVWVSSRGHWVTILGWCCCWERGGSALFLSRCGGVVTTVLQETFKRYVIVVVVFVVNLVISTGSVYQSWGGDVTTSDRDLSGPIIRWYC